MVTAVARTGVVSGGECGVGGLVVGVEVVVACPFVLNLCRLMRRSLAMCFARWSFGGEVGLEGVGICGEGVGVGGGVVPTVVVVVVVMVMVGVSVALVV